MNGFITVQEAAERWNITDRQVQILCKEGRIEGTVKLSRIWIIPEDAEKPTNSRQTPHKAKGGNHVSNDDA